MNVTYSSKVHVLTIKCLFGTPPRLTTSTRHYLGKTVIPRQALFLSNYPLTHSIRSKRIQCHSKSTLWWRSPDIQADSTYTHYPKYTMIPDWINAFAAQHPVGAVSTTASSPMKNRPFTAWSALDDVKTKADGIAHEASREFDVASQKAQEKTGKIEPGSLKYYAACTFGGMLACVSIPFYLNCGRDRNQILTYIPGPYPHCRDTPRPDQMSSPSRSQALQEQHTSLPHYPCS